VELFPTQGGIAIFSTFIPHCMLKLNAKREVFQHRLKHCKRRPYK
jgi:hypothetical protein